MVKFGTVTAYDSETQTATIAYVRPDACAKCGACGSLNKQGTIRLQCEAEVGNWVRITMPDQHFLGGAAVAYLIPLVFLIAGLLLASKLSGGNELIAMCGGLFGVLIALCIVWLCNRSIKEKSDWMPKVDRVYTEKPDIDDIGCPSHS